MCGSGPLAAMDIRERLTLTPLAATLQCLFRVGRSGALYGSYGSI
jgi:hypothetical protein